MNRKRSTVDEVIARHTAFERRTLKAQASILRLALGAGVQVSFGEGRRAADVAMVLLKGERSKVLTLPTQLEEELGLDVHIVRSTFAGSTFELLLVFTEPLEEQPMRSPERRAALRLQLERLERRESEESADLLDTDDQS